MMPSASDIDAHDEHSIRRQRCWCEQRSDAAQTGHCRFAGLLSGRQNCSYADVTLTEVEGRPHRVFLSAVPGGTHLLLLLSLTGDCTLHQQDREAHLGPGSLCLIRNDEPTEFRFHSAFRQIHIRFPARHLDRIAPAWEQSLACAIAADEGTGPILAATVAALMAHGGGLGRAGAKTVWRSILGLIGAALAAAPQRERPAGSPAKLSHKERIRRFVNAELRNPQLDMARISAQLGLSVRQIHRLYADEPGSLMRSVWDARLDQSYQDLTRQDPPERSIKDIALSWGFNDQAHFSRLFRKRFGLSPREVRHAGGAAPA